MIFNDADGLREHLERDVTDQDVIDVLFWLIVRDLRMEAS